MTITKVFSRVIYALIGWLLGLVILFGSSSLADNGPKIDVFGDTGWWGDIEPWEDNANSDMYVVEIEQLLAIVDCGGLNQIWNPPMGILNLGDPDEEVSHIDYQGIESWTRCTWTAYSAYFGVVHMDLISVGYVDTEVSLRYSYSLAMVNCLYYSYGRTSEAFNFWIVPSANSGKRNNKWKRLRRSRTRCTWASCSTHLGVVCQGLPITPDCHPGLFIGYKPPSGVLANQTPQQATN